MPTPRVRSDTTLEMLRFDRVQRGAHWANAVLFGVLMATAIPLYFGSFFGIVMQRHLMAQIHLWTGVALPLPVIVSLIGPWGRQMRRDIQRINFWTRDEVRWLKSLGGTSLVADKFNPGQKLNSVFIGATIVVMLATGSILQWFRFFPVPWRTGATFVHDVFALCVFVAVLGHVVLAVTHRDSLRSMFSGRVSESWAASHAARWLGEQRTMTGSARSEK